MNEHSSSNDDNLDLNAVVTKVQEGLRSTFLNRKNLILELGRALESTLPNSKNISKEIKRKLRKEISDKIITSRDIERYCPNEWKQETRTKKAKNDNLSISEQKRPQHILIDNRGNTISDPDTYPDDAADPSSNWIESEDNAAQKPTPFNSVNGRFFGVQFKISIKALRHYIDSSDDTIEYVKFSWEVDAATKSITGIQIVDDQ